MIKRVHVLISGRVQGVWFRASTQAMAEQLGLTGWVKNKKDGKVEAVFEGKAKSVQQMITWCFHGPPSANVETVEEQELPVSSPGFSRFSIKY